MGKSNKGAMGGAASGAAAGSSIMPGWGTAIGAVVGGVAGSMADTDGGPAKQVQSVDPAFLGHLYNQSMGTGQTSADMKMKAAFDQTLAQQVAAARASRGVNAGLMNRNVARLAQEQSAKAAQVGAEENLKNQEAARKEYMQAIGMNQTADWRNSQAGVADEERDSKRSGALLNSLGGAASMYAMYGKNKDGDSNNTIKEPYNTGGLSLSDSPKAAAQLNNDYSLGANTSINVPQFDTSPVSPSDERVKTKIKKITAKAKSDSDMVVVSDERQKDLIKVESLPANGNLGTQNQQAVQPQGTPMQTPMMAAQTAPTGAPAPAAAGSVPAPAPTPASSPAPVPASQTALAQANASLAKGGRIDDLVVKNDSGLVKPVDGPSSDELAHFAAEAQRQQRRDWQGNPIQSDRQLYEQFLNEWQDNNTQQKANYRDSINKLKTDNTNTTNEQSARLSKFYTGTTAVNANDLAQRYAPKVATPATAWKTQLDLSRAQQGVPVVPNWISASDERSKEDIKPESVKGSDKDKMNPKSFLDALTAYSYEYKKGQKDNPNAGEGRYLSVMAQDLEKAGPVGQSMVKQNEQGVKQVDYGKGFGAILAAQVQLNERLKQIEAKKGK
jgi:hypothetical protein